MLSAERGVAPLSAWGIGVKSLESRVMWRWRVQDSLKISWKFHGKAMKIRRWLRKRRWRYADGYGKYDDEDKGKVKKKQMEAIQSHLRPLGLSSRWENELVCVGRVNQTLFTWWSCLSFPISGDDSNSVDDIPCPSSMKTTFLGPMGGQMGASV